MNGRVTEVQRIHTSVLLDDGQTVLATVRGSFHETGEYPKVGDWVDVELVQETEEAQAVIERIAPRTSVITRIDQETNQPQVLVANVDIVLIVMGLDGDFNLKRLERYLLLARQSAVTPIIVLNKADVLSAAELATQQAAVAAVAAGVTVCTVTATTGENLPCVAAQLTAGVTAVLLGSSGAGKSTITNWLLQGDVQSTGNVRATDSRGRHTTTTRQLFTLPSGACLIDTPGMRELGLAEPMDEQQSVIVVVSELAEQCRFGDCDHDKSAGCAVLAAVDAGELSPDTLSNYYKLQREREWQQDKAGSSSARFAEQKHRRTAQSQAAALRRRLSRR